MANTQEFFTVQLNEKLQNNADLGQMGLSYQFNIDGAGVWSVHLKDGGSIVEGAVEDADCEVTCAAEDWEAMLDNPDLAMMFFMQGKLQVTNIELATKLTKILA